MVNFKIQRAMPTCPRFRRPCSEGNLQYGTTFTAVLDTEPSPPGGQWCSASHLKSVPPISCLDPRLLHTSNIVFKNVTTLVVFGHLCCEILATGLI